VTHKIHVFPILFAVMDDPVQQNSRGLRYRLP
jgi:hypothetical protein